MNQPYMFGEEINEQELLLLNNLDPHGVLSVMSSSKVFNEDYISFVWTAFNHGRKYLKRSDINKATAIAKNKLNQLLNR